MKFSPLDFKVVLEAYPSLIEDGFVTPALVNNFKNTKINASLSTFSEQRDFFALKFNEFEICCEWLSKFKTVKTPQTSSFFLKNCIQILSNKYVSNGAVIAAAVHLNISMKRLSDNSFHALIAISKNCFYIKKTRNFADLIID